MSEVRYSKPCAWCQGDGRVVKPSRLNPGTAVTGNCRKCGGNGRIES